MYAITIGTLDSEQGVNEVIIPAASDKTGATQRYR